MKKANTAESRKCQWKKERNRIREPTWERVRNFGPRSSGIYLFIY